MSKNGVTFFNGSGLHDGMRDVVQFGPLRFWADRGLIHMEDSRNNEYQTYSVRTFLHRARGISDMLMNSTKRDMMTEDQFDQANRMRHVKFLEACANLVEKAKVQGMPSDPTARRDLARRRPKTVVVPGFGGGL